MYKKALLIPVIALSLISPVYAASPIPSPVASPDMSDITQNLKKRLQETQGSSLSAPTTHTRAYIGIIKDLIKDTLIIEDKDGKRDIKLVDSTTIIRSPGNTTIKPESIRLGDYIIAIGSEGDDSVLEGKRLIVSIDPIKVPQKTSNQGTITKITKTSLTLKIGDKDEVLDTTTKTLVKTMTGTIELSELAVGDKIIFTALSDDNGELTATVIMRVKTSSL